MNNSSCNRDPLFCPPDKETPFSPTSVSNPSGKNSKSFLNAAISIAFSSSSSVASLFPNKIFSRAVLRTKYAPAVHNQSSRVHFHSSFYLKSHQKLQYLHLQADIGEEADVQASFSASCFSDNPSVSPCFNVKETFLNFLQLMKDMRKTHHQTEYNPALAQALDVSDSLHLAHTLTFHSHGQAKHFLFA